MILFLLTAAAPIAGAAERPHIVHIVADALGWKGAGFSGCTDIETPHFDTLAAEGAELTNFYVQPMGTPTFYLLARNQSDTTADRHLLGGVVRWHRGQRYFHARFSPAMADA